MVRNRLCDPDSKLGVLRWLETVALAEVDVTTITHQQLLRVSGNPIIPTGKIRLPLTAAQHGRVMDHQAAVDAVVAGLLPP